MSMVTVPLDATTLATCLDAIAVAEKDGQLAFYALDKDRECEAIDKAFKLREQAIACLEQLTGQTWDRLKRDLR